jgi:hypothetical protein
VKSPAVKDACLRQQVALCVIPICVEYLMPANLLDDLAEYVNVLSTGMEKTRRAEDRSACRDASRLRR